MLKRPVKTAGGWAIYMDKYMKCKYCKSDNTHSCEKKEPGVWIKCEDCGRIFQMYQSDRTDDMYGRQLFA